MSDILAIIEDKLSQHFEPTRLVIEDESHLHAGHAGARAHVREHGAGPSHIHIDIESKALTPLSRLSRHRAVMDAIADQVSVIHAIRLTVR